MQWFFGIQNVRMACLVWMAALALGTGQAIGQGSFPLRPIKIVVGSEAGSAPDALARVIANAMGARLTQSVIVENRPGAAGTIGAAHVAASPADGYTLLMGTVANVVLAPTFYPTPYDPNRDFTPIGMVASVPLALVTRPAWNVRNAADLRAKAMSQDVADQIRYASPGVGGPQHLAGVLLQREMGGDFLHVPYKSGSAAIMAVAADQVDMAFVGIPAATGLAQAGKVVPVFVTSRQRSAALPDVASTSEAGLSGFDIDNWHALFAPANLAAHVHRVLETALQATLAVPSVQDQFQKFGAQAAPGTGAELSGFVASETARWSQVVAENGLKTP